MTYAFKDKIAEVYKLHERTRDVIGGLSTESYELLGSYWCAAEQTADSISRAGDGAREEQCTYSFVFNPDVNVKLFDLIKYRGEWYEVLKVAQEQDYNTEKFVVADLKPRFTPTIYVPTDDTEAGE